MATFTSSADTMIRDAAADTNYGTEDHFQVGELKGGAFVDRALVKFNLATIPTDATINTATLRLYDVALDGSDNNRVMSVYRVLRAWVEGEATWNHYAGTSDWGTVGCANTTSDREAGAIGTVNMPATEVEQYYEITLTASKVQEWIDGTLTNNGVLLQMATETDDLHKFSSNAAASNKPQLVIDYTLPAGFFAIL